ncbi:MAG: peroxiredoxin [Thermoplasmata archaeon]|nr:peroxiredoxin [Thermoplasmata archaeon]
MVGVGELAPDFDAKISGGTRLKLSSLRGAPVVLYFYPEADTPGCTVESKGFRDFYAEFQARKVHIVGVSVDDVACQDAFALKYKLPFPLVADTSKDVATAYGVLRPSGRARRVTFLIDPAGKVVEIVDNPAAPPHVEKARQRFLS